MGYKKMVLVEFHRAFLYNMVNHVYTESCVSRFFELLLDTFLH